MIPICHLRPLSDWEAFDLLPAEVREYMREHSYCPRVAYCRLYRCGWTTEKLLATLRSQHSRMVAQYYKDMGRGFLQPRDDN